MLACNPSGGLYEINYVQIDHNYASNAIEKALLDEFCVHELYAFNPLTLEKCCNLLFCLTLDVEYTNVPKFTRFS